MWRHACLLGLLLVPPGASAELYRWTDDEGRVHFSDRAPDDPTREAKPVEVTPPKPLGQGQDLKQISEKLDALRDQDREREQAEKERAIKAKQELRKQCRKKQSRLSELQGRFVYERDDGTTYHVSREQAERDRQALRDWIAENCD